MAARQGVLAAIIAFTVIAAPAEATIRKGAANDRAGDTINGTSGHDMIAAAAQADDTGRVALAVKLAATPADNAFIVGVIGTTKDGACGAPGVILSSHVGTRVAKYAREDGANAKDAAISIDGDTVTLAADEPARLALPFDCAVAGVSRDGSLNDLYDESDALIALAPDAPPPAATPTPTPTPAAPVPVPAPTTASTPPVAVPKEAKLNIVLSGTPSTIKRNRTIKLKLKVANAGSKRSSKVSVSVGKARGLSVSKVKAFKALAPAKSKTVTLKVKLSKKAKTSTTLKVTVKAGKLQQSSSLLLKIGKAKKLAPAKTTPEAKKSPIVGTYWWRTVTHVDYAWDNRALYFADGGGVYSGFPAGGLPTGCATPPQKPDEEYDTREGCLPYTFDEKTGAVTVGEKSGTFKDGKLTIDGEGYYPLHIPPAGTRFNFAEHKHTSFSGMCGLFLGCTVTQKYLSLGPDGRFILSRSTTTTAGDPGMGPWTAVGSYPPDSHGTYEVLSGGRIQLSYADGTVKVETFAVDTNRTTGAPDPMIEGVLIGDENFYPEPT